MTPTTNEKAEEVLVALRQIIRAADMRSKQLEKTAGLTTPQLLLLRAISDDESKTIRQLSDTVSLSQATTTTILDRLEKRGLVYRERSTEDKRKVHARLTTQGREALAKAPTALQESFIRRFDALENWEQTMMVAALQRIAGMMGAEDLDASPLLDLGNPARIPPEPTAQSE